MHFNFKQGLFQSKDEILQYISEDGKEYVPYDYNFEEDVVPAINNLIAELLQIVLVAFILRQWIN